MDACIPDQQQRKNQAASGQKNYCYVYVAKDELSRIKIDRVFLVASATEFVLAAGFSKRERPASRKIAIVFWRSRSTWQKARRDFSRRAWIDLTVLEFKA